MDEIVKIVKEKTGISDDDARTAVDTVVNFIKTNLPPAFADQVDTVVKGYFGSTLGKGKWR